MNYEQMKKDYIKGWHTWNIRSVLSHVFMPEGFALNVAFKEYREDTGDFSRRISPTNFYALYAPNISIGRQNRIAEHYFNPEEFYGDWMLPSIARKA